MKKIYSSFLLSLFGFLAFFSSPAQAVELDITGLDHPETVIFDTVSKNYFISNINGTPVEKDNNGYISKVSADGLIVVLKFIEPSKEKESPNQLHCPTGMTIIQDKLYVADIDSVRIYNTTTGAAVGIVDLGSLGAKFLNDITQGINGILYVSDMLGNRIFAINTLGEMPTVEVWFEGEVLGGPNGLFFDRETNNLFVVTWNTGEILQISSQKEVKVLKAGLKNLDGIFMDRRGDLFVSSFTNGEIYKIFQKGNGRLTQFQVGIITPANISYDSDWDSIIIPLMDQNRVFSSKLTPASA